MAFASKDWRDYPDLSTPTSAAAMEDMETRLAAYTDAAVATYNITLAPYSALPGLPGDVALSIQAAIDDASAAGGGEVIVPPGTYTLGLHMDPGGTSVAACLFMRSNVTLRFRPGALFQLDSGAVAPGGATAAHLISTYKPFATATNDLKSNITLVGVVFDGRSNLQTLSGGIPRVAGGIFIGSTNNAWIVRCTVRNLRGTTNTPPGETFHFETNHSKHVRHIECEADGSGATDTSTGFSSDYSFGVSWVDCIAHDLSHGQGFTCWESSNLRYASCSAYSIGFHGYNLERCEDVIYGSCTAGGRSPLITASSQNPFFSSGQVSLSCVHNGFNISGGTDVSLSGCVSTRNLSNCQVSTNVSISPSLPSVRVSITGGDYRMSTFGAGDTSANLIVDAGQTDVTVTGALR